MEEDPSTTQVAHGPYLAVHGPYLAVHGPYLAVHGPYLADPVVMQAAREPSVTRGVLLWHPAWASHAATPAPRGVRI